MKYYLVYYLDGAMGIYARLQDPDNHQKGAKFFEVDGTLTVQEISALIGSDSLRSGNFPKPLKSKIKSL